MTMQQPPWVTLLVLGPALFSLADGCGRKITESSETDQLNPSFIEPQTTLPASHKLLCTGEESAITKCLNGGSCFALEVATSRMIACNCAVGYGGERCQFRAIDPSILEVRQENMRTAHIAAGVSLCILIVFVVLLAVYVYVRFRKRGTADQSRHSSGLNGTTAESHNEKCATNGAEMSIHVESDMEEDRNEREASLQPMTNSSNLSHKDNETKL